MAEVERKILFYAAEMHDGQSWNRAKVLQGLDAAVRRGLDDCEISWRECVSVVTAEELERQLKAEYKPLLTKR